MRVTYSKGTFSDVMKPDIEYTLKLMRQLHKGQTDHSGRPYALHPERIAQNVRIIDPQASDDVVMAALLHDTIEDCGIDEIFLRQKGYSEDCITMVRLVSKLDNDERPYNQVIDDLIASGHQGALILKIADNMDNLHPERIRHLMTHDPEKAQRLSERYRASIEKLCLATGIHKNRVFELINMAPNLESIDIALK